MAVNATGLNLVRPRFGDGRSSPTRARVCDSSECFEYGAVIPTFLVPRKDPPTLMQFSFLQPQIIFLYSYSVTVFGFHFPFS